MTKKKKGKLHQEAWDEGFAVGIMIGALMIIIMLILLR